LIAALDNTFLSLVLNEKAKPRPNPATGQPIDYWKERIDSMIDAHSSNNDTIIIPTPCLAEMLTAIPSVAKAIEVIEQSSAFEIAAFDARCAIELGLETKSAIRKGDKRSGVQAGWQEIKFDRQIAVVAKVFGASIFYTDDTNQTTFARMLGMDVKHTWDLPLPPSLAQPSFPLG
jgi:hypothetical protein